ncbi:hypothetical protein RJ641_030779 [Dillenia turbinata]|uniref:Uncharacterized protein n=1 Tax=Dillenia turbinata TaxID=194707 RepID=A0AAN8VWW8_9MAGN
MFRLLLAFSVVGSVLIGLVSSHSESGEWHCDSDAENRIEAEFKPGIITAVELQEPTLFKSSKNSSALSMAIFLLKYSKNLLTISGEGCHSPSLTSSMAASIYIIAESIFCFSKKKDINISRALKKGPKDLFKARSKTNSASSTMSALRYVFTATFANLTS